MFRKRKFRFQCDSLLWLQISDHGSSEDDQLPSQAYHWGGEWRSATSLSNPHPLPAMVELQAKTIAASDKELFVLSADGTVYKLTPSGKGKHINSVSFLHCIKCE